MRLARTSRPAVLLVAAALAISVGWAWLVPTRVAAARPPGHTIGKHLAHVPQALTPRSPTDERKDLRHTPQPITLSAVASAVGWRAAGDAVRSIASGHLAVAGALPQSRAPPAVL